MKTTTAYSIHPVWTKVQTLPLAETDANLLVRESTGKNSLNPQQHAALSPLTGHALINSGAGTGKTTVLVARMLSVSAQYPDARILMLTFSRKAALELKSRIGAVPNCQVSTFHSIAYHILRENGFRDFRINTAESTRDAMIAKLIGKQDTTVEKVVRALNRLTDIDAVAAKVKDKYFNALLKSKILTFDSMQPFALALLQKHPNVLHHLQHCWNFFLIDEYQDTDEVQQQLIALLSAKSGNICAVGDSRQSIYGFRGAVPSIMDSFAADAKVHELTVNYRSTPPIIGLANKVMPSKSPLVAASADKHLYPEYLTATNEQDEARHITQQIERLHKEGHAFKDMAILYRSSSLANAVFEELLDHHIPLICKGHANLTVFKAPYTGIIKLIRFALMPDDTEFKNIMPFLYLRKSFWKQIQTTMKKDDIGYLASTMKLSLPFFHQEYITSMANALENITAHTSPTEAVHALIRAGYGKYVGEDAATLVTSWADDLSGYPSLASYLAHLDELQDQLAQMQQAAIKTHNDCVQLMTIHASKGLEFKTVFLLGCYDGALPSSRDDADLEEERRLLYVAITRAKKRLYISYPAHTANSTEENKVSRFLQEAFS